MSNSDSPFLDRVRVSLNQWQAELPEQVQLSIESVLSGVRPCYIFGRNPNSEFMARYLPLQGFIDDYAEPGSVWLGLPVLSGADVPVGAAVINAVLLRRPHQALARLRELRQELCLLHYGDFVRHTLDRFPLLPFVEQAQSVFYSHETEFEALAKAFIDSESCQILHDILMFRLTADPLFTCAYRLRDQEQYFDIPLQMSSHPIFVDGGAYCGETTQLFCQNFPDYQEVYLFEPNPASLEQARICLQGYRDIRFYGYALGDRRETLAFDATAANASCITEHGQTPIDVIPLDDIVDGPVNFIKYDLEGYEPKALIGACQTIQSNHPTMAICVYHHAMDFIDVPRVIRESGVDYSLRLRHYTEGWEETVMYFTPNLS